MKSSVLIQLYLRIHTADCSSTRLLVDALGFHTIDENPPASAADVRRVVCMLSLYPWPVDVAPHVLKV